MKHLLYFVATALAIIAVILLAGYLLSSFEIAAKNPELTSGLVGAGVTLIAAAAAWIAGQHQLAVGRKATQDQLSLINLQAALMAGEHLEALLGEIERLEEITKPVAALVGPEEWFAHRDKPENVEAWARKKQSEIETVFQMLKESPFDDFGASKDVKAAGKALMISLRTMKESVNGELYPQALHGARQALARLRDETSKDRQRIQQRLEQIDTLAITAKFEPTPSQ